MHYHKLESDKIKKIDPKLLFEMDKHLHLSEEEKKDLLQYGYNVRIENQHGNHESNGIKIQYDDVKLWQKLLESKDAELLAEKRICMLKDQQIALLEKENQVLREANEKLDKKNI